MILRKRIGADVDSMKRYMEELAYRSSFAREKLKDRIHQPTVEPALRQFRDFMALYKFTDDDVRKIREAPDVERLEIIVDLFEAWFYKVRAPAVVSMTEPWDWYPRARQMRRRFIFHMGPTNSGKTHEALEKLIKAKSGVYCAPLKALASQVRERINETVPCDLLIGDERKFGGSAEHVSCTVEMTPIDSMVDVAVIDEIQLIADGDRGWAWTRALLGLPAKEIHLCGEPRALPLIRSLLWCTREDRKLSTVSHSRLVPLKPGKCLERNLKELRGGDCVVAFTRKDIFKFRDQIKEAKPSAQVNVVYGGLPYDVREHETSQFNQGVVNNKENILVTTDAIAYGLNMNIRRIVFSTMRKYEKGGFVDVPPPTARQVAGRAGRFGMKFTDCGYYCALDFRDHCKLLKAFDDKPRDLQQAGLLPTADILTIYAQLHGKEKMSFCDMMQRFATECRVSRHFFPCNMATSLLAIAQLIDDVEMPLPDKILFCFVPLSSMGDAFSILKQYAVMHAKGGPVNLITDIELQKALVGSGPLKRAEELYRITEVYCWLAWRLPNTFVHLEQGKETKAKLIEVIKQGISQK